ncbi:TerB family tellurite resistance protein [Alphaproteobacteria bacterium]|nr:TerB family tellurite resistance protein [Alphaproteobacteria bacterium]
MSVWRKFIVSAAGFALGGPIGALIGVVAGHAIDKIKAKHTLPQEHALKQIGFTVGVIVLSAKMAKADGKVTKEEIIAFKNKINVPEKEIKNVARLWDQAKKTTDGFEIYAEQICQLLGKNSSVLEELLNLLIIIAKADGKITKPEIDYLKQVSVIFGFSIEKFERIYSSSLRKMSDPYLILGVTKDTPILEIKNKWKALATNHHPDKLIAQGLPIDFIEKTTHRLQEINNAWDIIKRQNL